MDRIARRRVLQAKHEQWEPIHDDRASIQTVNLEVDMVGRERTFDELSDVILEETRTDGLMDGVQQTR